jgi:phosphoribosylamine---glycine ligase
MKVLVIGSGGREHAIVWALNNSPAVTKIFCAPGNPGIGEIAECVSLKVDDIKGLAQFAVTNKIDLTVVGSELPLVLGIVDVFEEHGLKIFGPSKDAARLEGSKLFLKSFLKRNNIPTADYATFNQSEYEQAIQYIQEHTAPYVIKTDGLAAGKGVAICLTSTDALKTLDDYFRLKVFGDAGNNIVVEEFMTGEEASVFALCDGENYVLLSSAQDHKQIFDGDKGKNTGGMGAYSPAPIVTASILEQVEKKIIQPTLKGMKAEGYAYKGCLYVGLMIKENNAKVVEFNVRLGDPETQVVLPLIDSDVYELFYSCATGTVDKYTLQLKQSSAVVVVVASNGYPDDYERGKEIHGLKEAVKDAIVFHAGTKKNGEKYVTAGGRVLGVTAIGSELKSTIEQAYNSVHKISFDGAYYRTDIGQKGLRRKSL